MSLNVGPRSIIIHGPSNTNENIWDDAKTAQLTRLKETTSLSWKEIASQIGTKDVDQCRRKFKQINQSTTDEKRTRFSDVEKGCVFFFDAHKIQRDYVAQKFNNHFPGHSVNARQLTMLIFRINNRPNSIELKENFKNIFWNTLSPELKDQYSIIPNPKDFKKSIPKKKSFIRAVQTKSTYESPVKPKRRHKTTHANKMRAQIDPALASPIHKNERRRLKEKAWRQFGEDPFAFLKRMQIKQISNPEKYYWVPPKKSDS